MAFSDARTKNRQYEPRLPDVPQFVAHWLYQASDERPAESGANLRDDCGIDPTHHHHPGLGRLLEYPSAAVITFVYILMALSVCLFYNINFVYVFLVVTNVILAFVRLLIFWQLRRDSWLIWFSATNIGKATAFFLAYMVIFKPELAAEIRPWLRLVWLAVFVFISIGAGDKASELAHFLCVKRNFYDSRKEQD